MPIAKNIKSSDANMLSSENIRQRSGPSNVVPATADRRVESSARQMRIQRMVMIRRVAKLMFLVVFVRSEANA